MKTYKLIVATAVVVAVATADYTVQRVANESYVNTTVTNATQTLIVSNAYDSVYALTSRTSRLLSEVQWVDLIVPGMSLGSGGAAPTLLPTGTGSGVNGIGYDTSDIGYGVVQMPHGLALTNSQRTILFVESHIHWSLTNTAAFVSVASTNVSWQMVWEWANINGPYSVIGTNTVTRFGALANSNHFVTSFGNYTNNGANISGLIRFRITRPSSGANDYGTAAKVLIDQIDFHVPVDRAGSSQIYSQ